MAMRWKAFVVVKLSFSDRRDAELLRHHLRRSLDVRATSAKILKVDPAGTPQFVYLRVYGRTVGVQDAGPALAKLVRGLRVDLGASAADIIHWDARRRGFRGMRDQTGGGPMRSGGGNGGAGTAGVREPRRPYPPGFPPMEATLDPPLQ